MTNAPIYATPEIIACYDSDKEREHMPFLLCMKAQMNGYEEPMRRLLEPFGGDESEYLHSLSQAARYKILDHLFE